MKSQSLNKKWVIRQWSSAPVGVAPAALAVMSIRHISGFSVRVVHQGQVLKQWRCPYNVSPYNVGPYNVGCVTKWLSLLIRLDSHVAVWTEFVRWHICGVFFYSLLHSQWGGGSIFIRMRLVSRDKSMCVLCTLNAIPFDKQIYIGLYIFKTAKAMEGLLKFEPKIRSLKSQFRMAAKKLMYTRNSNQSVIIKKYGVANRTAKL